METILEAVGGTLATLLTGGLTYLSVHFKQKKRGISKKQLIERIETMEKQAKENETEIKSISQKMDLVIDLIRTNTSINNKK